MIRVAILISMALTGAASAAPTSQPLPAKPGSVTKPGVGVSASSASDLGYLTADQLARRCGQSDPASSSYCFAYIAAVTDTARAYEIWLNAREFCLPPKISQSEVRQAFITYVTVYPARASGQAASVVVNALKQTYPCD